MSCRTGRSFRLWLGLPAFSVAVAGKTGTWLLVSQGPQPAQPRLRQVLDLLQEPGRASQIAERSSPRCSIAPVVRYWIQPPPSKRSWS